MSWREVYSTDNLLSFVMSGTPEKDSEDKRGGIAIFDKRSDTRRFQLGKRTGVPRGTRPLFRNGTVGFASGTLSWIRILRTVRTRWEVGIMGARKFSLTA